VKLPRLTLVRQPQCANYSRRHKSRPAELEPPSDGDVLRQIVLKLTDFLRKSRIDPRPSYPGRHATAGSISPSHIGAYGTVAIPQHGATLPVRKDARYGRRPP
jgi:hypothetical protein